MKISGKTILLFGLGVLSSCGIPDSGEPVPKTGVEKPVFKDVSQIAGLYFTHNPGVEGKYDMTESLGAGAALFDYDNDGDLDIYCVNGAYRNKSRDNEIVTNRLFRQDGSLQFTEVTAMSGLADTGYGMGVAIADIDNDNDLDVYITNTGADALYRNNGDGTFVNITLSAGIENPEWGCSATFLDIDNDGFLDIYVANYVKYDPRVICTDKAGRPDYCGPAGFPGVPDNLYRNNGNGTFSDVSELSGIAKVAGKSLGVVCADFNRDGLQDIYVSNDGEANCLWINQGDGTFQDEALIRGVALNELGHMEAGMGIAVGDADNDGNADLFVTHLRGESNTLYLNNRTLGFHDATARSGLEVAGLPFTGFGTALLDFDNDGDLDLVIVNGRVTRGPLLTNLSRPGYWDAYSEPNLLFENKRETRFERVGEKDDFSGTVENSRGLSVGDIDNDGDPDLLVINEGGAARLYQNCLENRNHWLIIRAFDPQLQRDAIGAEVTVHSGENQWRRCVRSGYSYLSANDLRVHFGLASQTSIDSVTIRWPDGNLDLFTGIATNQIMTLYKGGGTHAN